MAFLSVLLDGTAYGMILFIISVGLTVTMGLMRVVNLAHGAFAMTGGYLAAIMIEAGMPFFAAAILAALAVGALGAVAELVLYEPLYRRGELPQALMTFGFTFVVIAALTSIFGSNVKPLPIPAALAGNTDIGFTHYPTYRLFLIVLGAVMAFALWLVIDRTLYGARLRAAVDNPRMARAVGMDVNLLFTGTFAGGCALAGVRRRRRRRHAAGRALLRAALSGDLPGRGRGRRHRQFQGLVRRRARDRHHRAPCSLSSCPGSSAYICTRWCWCCCCGDRTACCRRNRPHDRAP